MRGVLLLVSLLMTALSAMPSPAKPPAGYKNFEVAVYTRAQEVRETVESAFGGLAVYRREAHLQPGAAAIRPAGE